MSSCILMLGVETFNEFFETRSGTDLVFERSREAQAPLYSLLVGSIGFTIFLSTGMYLATISGFLVLILAVYGLMAAVFYVGPPIRWAYRGYGELIIALAYGPFMTIGAYYIQTARIDPQPLIISIIPALLVFAVVLSNEIPQYHGDRIVEKMNLVVRLGQKKAARLHQILVLLTYIVLLLNALLETIPIIALVTLLTLPIGIWTVLISSRYYEYPAKFIESIRGTVTVYTVLMLAISLLYLYY